MQPGLLNKHLQEYMKGLSAKVFRTYNASITFQEQLDQGTPEVGTVQEKVNAYNHANRMVAILCNHQRAVPKTHESSMMKMKEKVRLFLVNCVGGGELWKLRDVGLCVGVM